MRLGRALLLLLLAVLFLGIDGRWTQHNSIPTGYDLFRVAQSPSATLIVGDDCVIIRTADGGDTWVREDPLSGVFTTHIPSGIIFTASLFENPNYPGVALQELRYDSTAGAYVAVAFAYGNGLSSPSFAVIYSNDSEGLSFAPVPNFDFQGVQEAPVFGNGLWVALNVSTDAYATPSVLTSADLSSGFTSQPMLLDCNCQVLSAPAWSISLNSFVVLLDREVAISSDGVTWKVLASLKYTPMPYPINNVIEGISPRPVFVDPVWLYFTNSSGKVSQVLLSLKNPRSPSSVALPLTVNYDTIEWLRWSDVWMRQVYLPRGGSIIQFSTDAYTWYNFTATLPYGVQDVLGQYHYPFLAVGRQGAIYQSYVSLWKEINTVGVMGSFYWVNWLAGPTPGFYASGNGFLEGAAPLASSPDGKTWAPFDIPSFPLSNSAQAIAYFPSASLSVATFYDSHVIAYSSDGFNTVDNFTLPKTEGSHPVTESVCIGDSPAIVVPSSRLSESVALTAVSYDSGSTWQLLTENQPDSPLRQCAYGNGVYLGFSAGSVYVSSNGSAWTKSATLPGSSTRLVSLKFVGSNFVAVGDGGLVFSSSSGYNWQSTRMSGGEGLNGLTFANGKYMVVGESGAVYASQNMASWSKLSVPAFTTLSDAAWSPDLNATVIVGSGGLVLLS